jgi:integrase
MNNHAYVCENRFHSYLAPAFVSYVEYKVNAGGCSPESFIPVLSLFDQHCMEYPEPNICLNRDTVHSYLSQKNVKHSTLQHNESILRSFGKYLVLVLQVEDVYVLPRLIRRHGKTFVPYVFSIDEIIRIFYAADHYTLKTLNKPTVNLANSIRCIVKTLYCTGMRVSEACNLKVEEVDLANRIIHINHAKNDNHRIVTISESLASEFNRYLIESENRHSSSVYFFDSGSPFNEGLVSSRCVYSYFRRYLRLAGIDHKGTGFGPRLHDLRVTFAVRALQRLTTESNDINAALAYLSAYMGHQSLRETQEYLWLDKDLFSSTLAHMDDYTSFISEIFDEKAGEYDD